MATDVKIELLICGYLREEENALKLYMNIPMGIAKIMHELYPLLLFTFGDYKHNAFKISNKGMMIQGNIENCSGYVVYANLGRFSNTGFNEGIHLWSVKLLAGKTGARAGCYASIGVTTEKNEKVLDRKPRNDNENDWPSFWITDKGCNSYFNGCLEWVKDKVITVKLDCNEWSATFYRDRVKFKNELLEPNKSYYFAMFCCGIATWTHAEVVDNPNV